MHAASQRDPNTDTGLNGIPEIYQYKRLKHVTSDQVKSLKFVNDEHFHTHTHTDRAVALGRLGLAALWIARLARIKGSLEPGEPVSRAPGAGWVSSDGLC